MLEDKENINNTYSYEKQSKSKTKLKSKTKVKSISKKLKKSKDTWNYVDSKTKVSLSSRGAGKGLWEMQVLKTIVPNDEDDMFNPMDVSHSQSITSHSMG